MSSHLFRTESFPVEGSEKVACVITGYGGKIKRYQSVIQALNKRGFTVIAYEHSRSVVTSGNPHDLLSLVDGICKDFAEKVTGYKKMICIGASAGAGLCFALQRRMPAIQYGIYAVAGMPGKDAIESPLFYFVRKKFKKHGFSTARLNSLWQEIDISPDEPPQRSVSFVIVLGKRDRLVRYEKALATLQAWQNAGVPIKIFTRSNRGHVGTIRWHKKHIDELLVTAERLTA
jgi:acetyl esterase/lipase